jgi:CDP-paratose 2-epimerase
VLGNAVMTQYKRMTYKSWSCSQTFTGRAAEEYSRILQLKIFVTGGAGFIGCHAAAYHVRRGDDVWMYDNLSRRGTDINRRWLESLGGERLHFIKGDIRDYDALRAALPSDIERLYHLAGQVAVTTSVKDPRYDFEANALGTLNVLEAVRQRCPEAVVIYASTNKVYGKLAHVRVMEEDTRYRFADLPNGVAEDCPLDFHSPYGCSKGCGDQYMLDYARIYGLKTVVFRQSCIYGERQFGVEDQGWLAYFCIACQLGLPITVYGNGKQVRDLLWVEDLIRAYEAAAQKIEATRGQVYNIGGGVANAMSVWADFSKTIPRDYRDRLNLSYAPCRPGDQSVYISDNAKAGRELGWKPAMDAREGIEALWNWVRIHEELFRQLFA